MRNREDSMKKLGIVCLVAALFILCAGCSRDMRSAAADKDEKESPYTYTYQEGARYRLVTGHRLQFIFPDQTTIFMSAGESSTGRIICAFEQDSDTEERIDNIGLGDAAKIQSVYVCCEAEDFILAVVHQELLDDSGYFLGPPQTTFISLNTKEQMEVDGRFLYEREGLYTKAEGCLGISLIRHVSCGRGLAVEETVTVEALGNQYMTKRPMTVLLKEGEGAQAEDFLDTENYFVIPAGTIVTVAGSQTIYDEGMNILVQGYYIKAALGEQEVTGWFLLDDDERMLLQDAALITVLTDVGADMSEQICSADCVTTGSLHNMMSTAVSAEQSYKLLLIDDCGKFYMDEDMLQNGDEAEETFSDILSEYTYTDMFASNSSSGIYSDYMIVGMPAGINGVSVDRISVDSGRDIIAVTCIYEDGSTTSQFYTDFLGRIAVLHVAEQGADGALVRTEEELQFPVYWEKRTEVASYSSEDGVNWDVEFADQYILKNDTKLRQGRLVLMQDGYTAEYMFMGADLLVRVK